MKVEIEKMDTTEKGALHPLFHRYEGQSEAQKAYITFSPALGSVSADWSSEIGDGMPASVWEGSVLRWRVSPELTAEEINDLMESFRPDFQKLADLVEEHGTGILTGKSSNTHDIDDSDQILFETQIAKDAIDTKMNEHYCRRQTDWDGTGIWEVAQWLENWTEIEEKCVRHDSTDAELERLSEAIFADARNEGVTLDGDVLEYLEDIRAEKIENEKNEQLRY